MWVASGSGENDEREAVDEDPDYVTRSLRDLVPPPWRREREGVRATEV